MILVTGTMRSGTSMWMQVLIAAGFEFIGDAFPEPWGETLRPANPRGFFESQLVSGVYHGTNPHPESGAYLFPQQTRRHVVKVFIPGLIKTDVAFVDHVVVTVREWRQMAASVQRMKSLPGPGEPGRMEMAVPAALLWWMENFALVRDIATRRYAAHVTTYRRLLDDPEREVGMVLKWLGKGKRGPAVRAVDPQLMTQGNSAPTPDYVEPGHAQIFDELYDAIHRGLDLTPAFVNQLNQTDRELRPRLEAIREGVRTDLVRRLAAAAPGGARA